MTVQSSKSHPAPVSRRFLKSIAAKLLTFTLAVPTLAQNTIHVPADQPTIQGAINAAAQNGDTVLVSPGTYKLTVSTSSVFRYGHQIGNLAPGPRSRTSDITVLAGLWAPILLCGIAGKVPSRLKHLNPRLLLLLAALGFSLQGCSGQLPLGTPAGDYVLRVTAADTGSATSHSVTLNLHVPQ